MNIHKKNEKNKVSTNQVLTFIMTTKSANGMYNYDDVYYNSTLDHWVELTHRNLSEKSGWTYYPLKKGAFGYDNLVVSIGHTFDKLKEFEFEFENPPSLEIMASWIHTGWAINYVYWRDNQPWLKSDAGIYRAPAKALADPRRDACATATFSQLDKEEQEKDLTIARFIMSEIFN